jgi:hypothetical protein
MNATEIARALADGPGLEEFDALFAACGRRQEELRELMRNAAARQAAGLKGLEALAAHDAEQERYARELPLLDQLAMAVHEAHEAELTVKATRELPAARKALPKVAQRVRDALAALDATLAEFAANTAQLAEFERLPGKAFPLTDNELAEVLTLRDAVWTQRNLAVLYPGNRELLPRSWALAHVEKPNGDWHVRRPGPWLPDYATDGR